MPYRLLEAFLMGRPAIDVVGRTFGFWHVERLMPKRRGLPRLCAALCTACGARKLVRKTNLLDGRTSHCGCRSVRDLAGLRVGRLKVVRRATAKAYEHAGAAWECLCDCGTACVVKGAYLVRLKNPVRSCGCTRQRNAAREHSDPLVRCQAYRPGIYNHRRVTPGEVLDVKVGSFCSSWLRRVPRRTPLGLFIEQPTVPERTTSAQTALDRELAGLRPFEVTAASRRHDAEDDTFGRAITCDDVPDFQEDR